MTPRGIRNCNPGNIRISSAPWQGKITPSHDPEFETFDTPENGIRALGKIILTYYNKHKLKTVRDIIMRWAPPTENNTTAYIDAVADQLLVGPDDELVLTKDKLAALVEAIIGHENGSCPYDMATVDRGIERAFA
jgi:hypothetical protein